MQYFIVAEYVWIGGSGSAEDLRSKARTLTGPIYGIQDIPEWSYDGSSCGQATADSSDVKLKPVHMFPDPFRGNPHILVLCESIDSQNIPIASNFRHYADELTKLVQINDIWIGFE
jgi:glutamine synthetase